MAARPRKRDYRNLPDSLFFDKSKNIYRLILVNGKKKNIRNDKALPIPIAREYNNIMRPLLNISINF
ncbi:MAG: hypothetical protein ACL7BU_10295 [Candidatus Phlomobacter fragariae]